MMVQKVLSAATLLLLMFFQTCRTQTAIVDLPGCTRIPNQDRGSGFGLEVKCDPAVFTYTSANEHFESFSANSVKYLDIQETNLNTLNVGAPSVIRTVFGFSSSYAQYDELVCTGQDLNIISLFEASGKPSLGLCTSLFSKICFNEVSALFLGRNKIPRINLGTFPGTLSKLEKIYLQNNIISVISVGSFRYLPLLTVLDLSYNLLFAPGLSSLQATAGYPMSWAVTPDVGNAEISMQSLNSVGLLFAGCRALKELQLESTGQVIIVASSFNMNAADANVNLEVLNLNLNNIVSILPRAFNSLCNLRQLLLRSNRLVTINMFWFNSMLEDRTRATLMQPSCNGGEEATVLFNLEILDLNDNNIQDIEVRCAGQENVNAYAGAGCDAGVCSEGGASQFCQSLNGAFHGAFPIASPFDGLTKLKTLSLSHNNLDNIDAGVLVHFHETLGTQPKPVLPNLTDFFLDHNNFKVIRKGFLKGSFSTGNEVLPSLENLHLNGNLITSFDNESFYKFDMAMTPSICTSSFNLFLQDNTPPINCTGASYSLNSANFLRASFPSSCSTTNFYIGETVNIDMPNEFVPSYNQAQFPTCPSTPVNCVQSSWTPYSVCSVTCASGVEIRTRTILSPATDGGICFSTSESQVCSKPACTSCPPNSNGITAFTGCRCNAGFRGTITYNVASTAGYDGTCTAISCSSISNSAANKTVGALSNTVPTGCICNPGFAGIIAAASSEPFYTGSCTVVACPFGSSGSFVHSGCTCSPGFRSTPLTPSRDFPFYTGSCTPVTCPINSFSSTSYVHSNCTCSPGMTGAITASLFSPFYVGECVDVVCPIGSRSGNQTLRGGCTCNIGWRGSIQSITTSSPFFTGGCSPVACPAFSASETTSFVHNNCTCFAGHAGTITATSSEPFFTGTCTAVKCPSNTDFPGESIVKGCPCLPGFAGTIVPTKIAPKFYDGSCIGQPCPAFSSGDTATVGGLGFLGCGCNKGYSGSIIATTQNADLSYHIGSCSAVACPVNSHSSTGFLPSGCICDAGYSGVISATIISPTFHSGVCVAIACPAGSNGLTVNKVVPEGCECNAGYSGSITKTSSAPKFYNGDCTAVLCPQFTFGTNLVTGCSVNPGYSGTISATKTAPYYDLSYTAVSCPDYYGINETSRSSGLVINGCPCINGYGGALIQGTTTAPFYSGRCDLQPCPSFYGLPTIGTDIVTGCACPLQFTGGVSASIGGKGYTGICIPPPCPPDSTGVTGLVGCKCNAGFSGSIGINYEPPYYTGSCVKISCVSVSPFSREIVPGTCKCNDGYSGVMLSTTISPFISGTCTPVSCPAGSTSSSGNVLNGCFCNPGWSGYIPAASGSAPFYTGGCMPVTCPVQTFRGDFVHSGCLCKDDFVSLPYRQYSPIQAISELPFFTGSCISTGCPPNSNASDVGCECEAGFQGTITFSNLQYVGVCQNVQCPLNSLGDNRASGCSCNAGYSGIITKVIGPPYSIGSCVLAICPNNSEVASEGGCSCKAGFSGIITATTSSPYFVGACLPVVCPAFSNGTSLGSGCRCNRGYNGTITAVTASVNSNMYTGTCANVSCPPGSSGASVTSGCLCMAGYSGTIILSGNTGAPFYTGSCVALVCPVYSTSINAGGKLHEGCICNSGYVGTISATTLSPNFFSGSCILLSCPVNSRRNITLGPSACTCNAGFKGTISSIVGAPYYTGSCDILCPTNSTGTTAVATVVDGCKCNPGFNGSVITTDVAPNFFISTCRAVACPLHSYGISVVDRAGCSCDVGYSGLVSTSSNAPFFTSTCVNDVVTAKITVQLVLKGVQTARRRATVIPCISTTLRNFYAALVGLPYPYLIPSVTDAGDNIHFTVDFSINENNVSQYRIILMTLPDSVLASLNAELKCAGPKVVLLSAATTITMNVSSPSSSSSLNTSFVIPVAVCVGGVTLLVIAAILFKKHKNKSSHFQVEHVYTDSKGHYKPKKGDDPEVTLMAANHEVWSNSLKRNPDASGQAHIGGQAEADLLQSSTTARTTAWRDESRNSVRLDVYLNDHQIPASTVRPSMLANSNYDTATTVLESSMNDELDFQSELLENE